MSDNDQLTDSPELRELGDALSGVAMPGPPRLEAITARGRARRRHRLAAVTRLSVAGVTAGIALALGLSGALSPAPTLGTIRTAAFKLVRNHNGTDTLTINPSELLDPATLQSDLAKYGIPAKVTVGSVCSSDPAPAGISQVVSSQPTAESTVRPGSGEQHTITFDPKAMPAGTKLSFSNFRLSTGQEQTSFALIDTSSYTCTSTPPTLSGPDSWGVLDGRHAAS